MTSTKKLLDPEETFSTLSSSVGLDNRLRKALSRLGYVRPTLVQSKCLPLAISSGRDLLVRARTGSGKTLAYCLPILHKILQKDEHGSGSGNGNDSDDNDDSGNDGDNNNNNNSDNKDKEQAFVKAVILVPTRELCTQVTNTIKSLTYYCDEIITVGALFSGKNSNKSALIRQEAMLRDKPNILVSTPAGLLTHIQRKGSMLSSSLKHSVESLVVDEADLVLSFGTLPCIRAHLM